MSESRPLFTWDALEGEYTRWEFRWIVDLWAAGFLWEASPIVDNDCIIYCRELFNGGMMAILDHQNIIELDIATDDNLGDYGYFHASITNKYVSTCLWLGFDEYDIHRRGVVLQGITPITYDPAYNFSWDYAFSPNGKWFIISYRALPSISKIMIFEGIAEGTF